MNKRYTNMMDDNKTLSLTLEDDSELTCLALCKIHFENVDYIALLPLTEDGEQNEEGDLYFYRYAEDQEGIPLLSNIETEEEFAGVSEIFDLWIDDVEAEKELDWEE